MGHYEDHLNRELQKAEEEQRLYEQTMHELRTEERFVNFFKRHTPETVEQFIAYYAQQKVQWYGRAENYERYAVLQLQRERMAVVDLLANVMKKKVFDLKCRWVAGEMDIEGVEVSADFEGWKTMPALLEAAGTIRPDEFYCYLDYFKEGGPKRLDRYSEERYSVHFMLHFYHYARARSIHLDPEEEIPEWFHHYDHHFGTAHLRHLSALRFEMEADQLDEWSRLVWLPSLDVEKQRTVRLTDRATVARLRSDPEFYRQWREEDARRDAERQKKMDMYDDFSVHDEEIMEKVIRAIEPREVLHMYRNECRLRAMRSADDFLFTPLNYLKEVKEHVAVDSHENYRESIQDAYYTHLHSTTVQALVMLYETYETCMRDGTPFDWGKREGLYDAESSRKRILEIRQLKGLPANFDFLKKENLP